MTKSTIFGKFFDEICIFRRKKNEFLAAKSFGAYISMRSMIHYRQITEKLTIVYWEENRTVKEVIFN